MAQHWGDWGSPLRPSRADIDFVRGAVAEWQAETKVDSAKALLLGVTPEYASIEHGFPVELLGMDRSPRMIQAVWPGDVPGRRRAAVGDWFQSGLPDHSQDIIIADGSFVFFDPKGMRQLTSTVAQLLKPNGIFICRLFAAPAVRESVERVVAAARAGEIENFHIFKWRVAMALQTDVEHGVEQHDIWEAVNAAEFNRAALPQPGFSEGAMSTIRFYERKTATLHFPTLAQFGNLVGNAFASVRSEYLSYPLAERCPFVVARP